MVKTSAHDCFRICVKTALTLAARQDGRGGGAARPHRGDDVLEGVKARQHGEDLLRPVCDLGQLQRQSGVTARFGCPVAPLGGRPPVLNWEEELAGRDGFHVLQ